MNVKTWLAKELAALHAALHAAFPNGVSTADIINGAEDLAAMVNIGKEIAADVKVAGTDPAAITEALTGSLIKHMPELPSALQGNQAEAELIQICKTISGLPLDVIENAVKAALAGKK